MKAILVPLSTRGRVANRVRLQLKSIPCGPYSKVLVKNCAARQPVGGATTSTRVPSIGVQYLSWTRLQSDSFRIVRPLKPLRVMRAFKRPVVLLDVGANVGKITFPTLALPQGHRVIAVEPVAKNMDILCKTAALNRYINDPRLILAQAAVSAEESFFQIYVPEGREDNAAMNASAENANVGNTRHPETVRTVSGTRFLQHLGLSPDVIKIDVQGHELSVLKSLSGYLRHAENTLVVAESDPKLLGRSRVNPKDIYKLMVKQLGYTPYLRIEVEDIEGTLRVQGQAVAEDEYPPKKACDIWYMKQ